MKKVLILAYDFPPYVSVGGQRPYSWYQHLKSYGVEPIIVTRQWGNKHGNYLDYIESGYSKKTIVETDINGTILRSVYRPNLANRIMLKHGENKYKLLRKVVSAFYEFAQFILPVGPKIELYKTAHKYLKENKVDAIIATGDPFILFRYAHILSRKFNIPWIADYRDPWSSEIHLQHKPLLRGWSRFQEKKTVRSARKITTVNAFFKKEITSLIKNVDPIILPNGYNDQAINDAKGIQQNEQRLTIAFAGSIYAWHPIQTFLTALNAFNQESKCKIHLAFYGINNQYLLEHAMDNLPELNDYISIHPKMQDEELVKTLSKSNAFLLFNDYNIIGTKIYTYLGLKRLILFCFTNDNKANKLKEEHFMLQRNSDTYSDYQADLIRETNAGIVVENALALKKIFNGIAQEFNKNGKIECNSKGSHNYSRKIQVERLSNILKDLKN